VPTARSACRQPEPADSHIRQVRVQPPRSQDIQVTERFGEFGQVPKPNVARVP
jgi:hypothetical protein